MRIALYFPPHWTPAMPHLALGQLTACLRAERHTVTQSDLNAEAFDALLSRSALNAHVEIARRRLARGGRALTEAERAQLTQALTGAEELIEDIDVAKRILRSPAFFQPDENLGAMLTVIDALELTSAPYWPTTLSWYGYQTRHPPDSIPHILAEVRDPRRNLFLRFFQERVTPQLAAEKPELVGISLSSAHQIVPGLTLAALVKTVHPQAHVVVGGKMITCWRDVLPHHPEVFALFDSAVYLEGDRAIVALAEALAHGSGLQGVPNLIYRHNGRILVNEPEWVDDVDALPVADWDGLELGAYLAPTSILPIEGCRGCYWGRCAFCNLGYGQSRHVRCRRAEHVAEEMVAQHERHGVRHFFFVDEALSPAFLQRLAHALTEPPLCGRAADLHWAACARFEEALDEELLTRIHDAGCRMLMFGLEGGSQPLLDRIRKGTELSIVSRILCQSAEAGIWNHVFCFFGFPGETEADAQATVAFLIEHLDVIHSVAAGTFVLDKGSDVHAHPAAHGVAEVAVDAAADLAFRYDYTLVDPANAADPQQSLQRLVEALDERRRPSVFYDDPYNLLYASAVSDWSTLWRAP